MPFNKWIQDSLENQGKQKYLLKNIYILSFYQSKGRALAMMMATAAKTSHYQKDVAFF